MRVIIFFGILLLPFIAGAQPASCNGWDELASNLQFGNQNGLEPGDEFYFEDSVSFRLLTHQNGPDSLFGNLFIENDAGWGFGNYARLEQIGLLADYTFLSGINSTQFFSVAQLSDSLTIQVDDGPVYTVASPDDLPQEIAPAITFEFVINGERDYAFNFRGPLRKLFISADSLLIDNICFVQTGFLSDCTLGPPQVEFVDCTPDSLSVIMDFPFSDHGFEGFGLRLSSGLMDTFSYADLPIDLGTFPQETQLTIDLQDVSQPDCRYAGDLPILVCPLTSSSEESLTDLSFFPNPLVDGMLHFSGLPYQMDVWISSIDGRFRESYLIKADTTIDLAHLPSGHYTLRFVNSTTIITHKLLVP